MKPQEHTEGQGWPGTRRPSPGAATVRRETAGDGLSVRRVNELAFGRPGEADLVDRLRGCCPEALSLVAEAGGEVAGHVLFTPVSTGYGRDLVQGMGLAPVAVLPRVQRQGIGSALIRAGIERLKRNGCPYIVVLGHPDYYPRFGFVPASRYGVHCGWDVPDEAFMLLLLDETVEGRLRGLVSYRPEFDQLAGE
jgi:putative acetyltransferase